LGQYTFVSPYLKKPRAKHGNVNARPLSPIKMGEEPEKVVYAGGRSSIRFA
jgi:hypothetical protein